MGARARRKRRAAAAAHPRPGRRRRLGGRTASRRAPAPSARPTKGMRGLPLAQRTWERVGTGWGGGQSPPRSPRRSAVHSRGLRGEYCAREIVPRSHGGRPVVWVRKRWKKDKGAVFVWRHSGVGVGDIVSEQRCLLLEHPQKMHIFRRRWDTLGLTPDAGVDATRPPRRLRRPAPRGQRAGTVPPRASTRRRGAAAPTLSQLAGGAVAGVESRGGGGGGGSAATVRSAVGGRPR